MDNTQSAGKWLASILVILAGYGIIENVAPQYTFYYVAATLTGVIIFYFRNRSITA